MERTEVNESCRTSRGSPAAAVWPFPAVSLVTSTRFWFLVPMAVHFIDGSDVFWTILVILLPFYVYQRVSTLQSRRPPEMRSVTIVVLGDIGRSPRMMYHAESFAREGFETTIVGYSGTHGWHLLPIACTATESIP